MINVILFFLALVGSLFICYHLYTEIRFRGTTGAPKIFYSTISKHNRYSTDRKVAENILKSYLEIEEYHRLLIAYSEYTGKDLKSAIRKVGHALPKLKIVAKNYYKTDAYEDDKELARGRVEHIFSEVKSIQKYTNTNSKSLHQALNLKDIGIESRASFMSIHNENLRKCDIIRPYNHKSTPLRDLSMELISTLKNIEGKEGMESARDTIYKQLTQLSTVIDSCIEDLPTFDSKRYVDNKLKINQKLLEEIDNTQYIDVFQINNHKNLKG